MKVKFYCFEDIIDDLETDYVEFTNGVTYEGNLSEDESKLEIIANRGEPVTFFFGKWRNYFRKCI